MAKLNIPKLLVRLLSDHKEIAATALAALVNMSESAPVRKQLHKLKMVNVAMEAINDKSTEENMKELYTMLLANLTSDVKG